jgi:protein prenyltransferase alpha subunit repeat containing protein 1
MSRALDEDTVASISSGNPQTVYNDIVEALSCSRTGGLLEIEFIGKSHSLLAGCNALCDGNSITIPKLKLVQAFVVARQLLFKLKDDRDGNHQDLSNATAVIILMDPEHLTAVNARKRIIQECHTLSPTELGVALKRDLVFIDSLLTSPLHRHTKSPTLWGHRRWILEVCQSIQMPLDIQRDLTAVVLIAAERHPRNYYAWSHMRWILKTFTSTQDTRSGVTFDYSKVLFTVKNWCLRHPSDTSGWSFLLFALFSPHSPEALEGTTGHFEEQSSICTEVLGLAVSFRWIHESVWVFLRTLVGFGEVTEDERAAFFTSIKTIFEAQPGNAKAQSILGEAHDWCIKYEQRPQS